MTLADLTPIARGLKPYRVKLPYMDEAGFPRRLAAALRQRQASPADLARWVGVSDAAISFWLDGTTAPSRIRSSNLRRAAQFVNRSVEFLLEGADDPSEVSEGVRGTVGYATGITWDVRQVPVISYVQAGSWSEASDPYPRGQGFDQVGVDASLAKSLSRVAFGLAIEGRSMEPDFIAGDVVIIDPHIAPHPGDFVVAKLDREEQATFKKYRDRGADSAGQPIFELVPLNHDYPTLRVDADNPGHVVGVMVEHRRRRRAVAAP